MVMVCLARESLFMSRRKMILDLVLQGDVMKPSVLVLIMELAACEDICMVVELKQLQKE